jgi:hypothetical protein
MVGTFHLIKLNNLSLKINLAKIHSNKRNSLKITNMINLKVKRDINLLKEMKILNSKKITNSNKRELESFKRKRILMKYQGQKVKTTDQTQTTNMIEDQTMIIERMITTLPKDIETIRIFRDNQDSKTTKNSIKNMITVDTNKISKISDKEETTIKAFKDQIIIKIGTMTKDKIKEITTDNLMREDRIEIISKIKTQSFQKNIKEMTIKLTDNFSKRRLINLTHL